MQKAMFCAVKDGLLQYVGSQCVTLPAPLCRTAVPDMAARQCGVMLKKVVFLKSVYLWTAFIRFV